jgi:hypothetical protein
MEVSFALSGHVADNRRNRRFFHHRKKKAVENCEMIKAVRFIQYDFARSHVMRRPAGRAVNHIYPIDSGRTRNFNRGENDGGMFVTVVGINPDADNIPLA